jgi:polyribonucleotide nucleotidyltransferase
MIKSIVREVEDGVKYTAKVVKVEDFGCFVQLWPGCEGLVHVSQLAHERVEKASDMVKVGDEIIVMSLGYDQKGRLNLSRKAALPKPAKKEDKEESKEEKKAEKAEKKSKKKEDAE